MISYWRKINWYFINLPQQDVAQIHDANVSTIQSEGEDKHAGDGGHVERQRGLLEAVSLVQDHATDHGARHARHYKDQTDSTCV